MSTASTAATAFLGTGAHLPGEPVSTAHVASMFEPGLTTAEWITDHTGIEQRHWADPGLATSDLAAAAARQALAAADCSATDLDRIILCTTTSDWTSPAAASRVQALLGATCPAEDKQVACSSWIFGLDHGVRLVATGADRVLVVGADIKSRFVGEDDHRLRPILADGAGAVVLGPVESGGVLDIELYSDGRYAANMFTPAGGSALPASHATVDAGAHFVQMGVQGREIKHDAIQGMASICRTVLARCSVDVADVAVFIAHQANLSIVHGVADELGVERDRFPVTIDRTGNIVSATLPYTLDHVVRSGDLRPGDLVVLCAFGAGYSGGAAVYQVPDRP